MRSLHQKIHYCLEKSNNSKWPWLEATSQIPVANYLHSEYTIEHVC